MTRRLGHLGTPIQSPPPTHTYMRWDLLAGPLREIGATAQTPICIPSASQAFLNEDAPVVERQKKL